MSMNAVGPPVPRPLVVSADTVLTEELLRLCAAASVSPEVIVDPELARRAWAGAPCVLVGADRAAAVASLGLGRRESVVLVAREPESPDLWRLGISVRADHVVVLPDGESWLVDRLADSVDGGTKTGVTVGVMAARGGAGASTLAAALGLCAARRGETAILIDVDPSAGGIELVVGSESAPGLRWSEVAMTRGRVTAPALRKALPSIEGLSVLSWTRLGATELDPATLREIVSSAQRGGDVVILDIGRRVDELTVAALSAVDVLLLVSTLDLRAAAAAAQLVKAVRSMSREARLVCRRSRRDRLEPEALARTLQLPLAGMVTTRRAVVDAVEDGLGPLLRGRMTRECERILDNSSVAGLPLGHPLGNALDKPSR